MRLSRRLMALADLAGRSSCVADIGCDHGQLGAFLLGKGLADRLVACDISAPSLEKARALLAPYGTRASCRLSDGLSAIAPGEADCVVIAGMGGQEIIRILADGDEAARRPRLVLGPHRNTPELRSWLLENGYAIRRERLVVDSGHFYALLEASAGSMDAPYTPLELVAGRYGARDWDQDAKAGIATMARKARAVAARLATRDADGERRLHLERLAEELERMLQERHDPCGSAS